MTLRITEVSNGTAPAREARRAFRGRRSAPRRRSAVCAVVVLLAAALLAPAASAHTGLASSSPAAGDTVASETVREVRLRFSGDVQPRFTSLFLLGPAGDTVASGVPEPVDGGRRHFVLPLAVGLAGGEHVVVWRTAGADGHALDGRFSFFVTAPEPAPADTVGGGTAAADSSGVVPTSIDDGPATATADTGDGGDGATLFADDPTDPGSPLRAGLRWLNYVALLGMVGAAAFGLLVLGRLGDDADRPAADDAARRLRRVALALAALSAAMLAARLGMQAASLAGPASGWTETAGAVLGGTAWGAGWWLQLAGTVVVALGVLAARTRPTDRGAWSAAAAGALLLCLAPPPMGHAATSSPRWLAVAGDALHVLGGGAWLGGLAALALAAVPAAFRAGGDAGWRTLARTVHRFSPVALAGVGLAALTGVGNALFHFGAVSDLWTTAYGWTLLAKLALLAGAAALGAYNWRRVRPRLGDEASSAELRSSARLELALGLGVLLATAVLVALPTP